MIFSVASNSHLLPQFSNQLVFWECTTIPSLKCVIKMKLISSSQNCFGWYLIWSIVKTKNWAYNITYARQATLLLSCTPSLVFKWKNWSLNERIPTHTHFAQSLTHSKHIMKHVCLFSWTINSDHSWLLVNIHVTSFEAVPDLQNSLSGTLLYYLTVTLILYFPSDK